MRHIIIFPEKGLHVSSYCAGATKGTCRAQCMHPSDHFHPQSPGPKIPELLPGSPELLLHLHAATPWKSRPRRSSGAVTSERKQRPGRRRVVKKHPKTQGGIIIIILFPQKVITLSFPSWQGTVVVQGARHGQFLTCYLPLFDAFTMCFPPPPAVRAPCLRPKMAAA